MKLNLPSTYLATQEKYEKYNGLPKVSYSQITSWKDYRGDYIAQRFLGLDTGSNIFADFGSWCGSYWETGEIHPNLSQEDGEILKKLLPRPSTAKYETEIVIDRGDYVIQGFIDQEVEEQGRLIITDLKTGNHTDKPAFYRSSEYQQTRLYSYARHKEGYEIENSQVFLLERKGNTLDRNAYSKAGNPLWLRLSGEIKVIPTPYDEKETEAYLKTVDKVVQEISDYYTTFQKYFT